MTPPLLRRLWAVPFLLVAAGLFVRVVPEGSIAVLQNRVGRSNPLLVPDGIRWRVPIWEGLYVYSRDPVSIRGEVSAVSRDSLRIRIPFELKVRLDEEKVIEAHRGRQSGEDASGYARRMVSNFIADAARRAAAYQLLRESLPASLETALRHRLEAIGLVAGLLVVASAGLGERP